MMIFWLSLRGGETIDKSCLSFLSPPEAISRSFKIASMSDEGSQGQQEQTLLLVAMEIAKNLIAKAEKTQH